jgi:hypothetical protein
MKRDLHVGDHVECISEAGRFRGRIRTNPTSAIMCKDYMVRASKEEPQYLIRSDTTDQLAIHKRSALGKLKKRQ